MEEETINNSKDFELNINIKYINYRGLVNAKEVAQQTLKDNVLYRFMRVIRDC